MNQFQIFACMFCVGWNLNTQTYASFCVCGLKEKRNKAIVKKIKKTEPSRVCGLISQSLAKAQRKLDSDLAQHNLFFFGDFS